MKTRLAVFLVLIAGLAPLLESKPTTASSPASGDKRISETAPTAESRERTEIIARMDAKMFDAFNAHNVDALMAMFTDDLEFYHDTGGLTNYQQTKESFKKLFAGTPDIKRDLIKGSLEVYPIKEYGAIEIGTHRFRHKQNGKDECGSFKFVNVWQKSGDSWRVSRVISYGH